METETEMEHSRTPVAKALGLGRLTLLLVGSILGIAGFFHVMYGVSLLAATAVVGEIGVVLVLAFAYAWRSSR
jgi:hypothetical protein